MTLYTSMRMMRSNENNIMYSNNIVIIWKRRISFFVSNYLRILIEDLRTLANLKRQMKKPKSTVKRMVDYFKQSPIPLAPQTNMTEVRRAMKSYARAFKINIVNDRDPLLSCKKQGKRLVDFLSA